MTQLERSAPIESGSGEQPHHKQATQVENRGIAIHATPLPNEGVVFQKAPGGGVTLSFQGKITIDLPPAMSEAAGAVLSSATDVGFRLLPAGTPPLEEIVASSETDHRNEREIITKHITFTKTSEFDLRPSETPANGLVLEGPTESLSVQHSASDVPSSEASGPQQTDSLHIPESENEKFEFVGNPVRDPAYWVRRSGKRVAEFVLATHRQKEKTLYYRIRAFGKQAERVRDTVRKGQTGVEVVAYGPKYWPVTRRTNDGQEKKEAAQGYYAGFVHVPKRYREEPPATQQPLE
jgi:hypothetical protein